MRRCVRVCVCVDIQSPEVLAPPGVESHSCWAAWHGCRYGTWQEQFPLSHRVVTSSPFFFKWTVSLFIYVYMGRVEVRRWLVGVNSVFLPPGSQWSKPCHQAWVPLVLWSTEPNWRPWSCVSYFETGCFNYSGRPGTHSLCRPGWFQTQESACLSLSVGWD